MSLKIYSLVLLMFLPSVYVFAQDIDVSAKKALDNKKSKQQIEVISILGERALLNTETGSAAVLNQEQLEQFEFDDIHRVLQSIPGVYVREEDGYGLRPNIGLRGATTERSSKVAIMEDGVLIAPAPYAAPAAYYFPLISRMSQVEVFKGPAAILYGPNTIGGAINMVSQPIEAQFSDDWSSQIDLAVGEFNYQKAHGLISVGVDNMAAQLEGLHLSSDGFKQLNGQNTGFDKNEFLFKASYSPENTSYEQFWQFKAGVSSEVSHETYLVLTDDDFSDNPYQRYAASQKDKMDWKHYQFQLSHFIELTDDFSVFTQAYHREFERDWNRFNSFNTTRTMQTILNSPHTGLNALFMEVLTGERDSFTSNEEILFTLNNRRYFSQGIESKIKYTQQWDDYTFNIDAGLRLHQDQVKRNHRTEYFVMSSGLMQESGEEAQPLTVNKDTATAVAGYINVETIYKQLTTTFGLRIESIDGEAVDYLGDTVAKSSDSILLPGIGVFYKLSERMGVLFGVNKGFVPNGPGQDTNINPEESWNYELGYRYGSESMSFETIGFFNDYANLKATCTFSSSCDQELDQEFNGGKVYVYGLEASVNISPMLTKYLKLPINLAYTYTQSEFQNEFSSSFSQWGDVDVGDELPYLPKNQLTSSIGLASDSWNISLMAKFVSAMKEAAGSNTELENVMTDELIQFDLSAWYLLNQDTKLYAKVDNLTDNVVTVSRRPFGARPNKPQQLTVGIKYNF